MLHKASKHAEKVVKSFFGRSRMSLLRELDQIESKNGLNVQVMLTQKALCLCWCVCVYRGGGGK